MFIVGLVVGAIVGTMYGMHLIVSDDDWSND